MSYPFEDNVPVADELAAMGYNTGGVVEPYKPISPDVVEKEVDRILACKDGLEAYRDIQALALTEIQAKVLNAISDRKIEEASLRDLVGAFKTLKEKEHLNDGKPTEITGLVGYLIQIEKEEKEAEEASKEIVINPGDVTDGNAENNGADVR